jgi:large subunit ribosomal protein L5
VAENEKQDKPEQADKPDKPEKGERQEKADRPDKADRADKGDRKEKKDKKGKGDKPAAPAEPAPPPRLRDFYREKVVPGLRDQFRYKNPMQVPTLRKIVVNMGVGKATENKARIEHALRELSQIAGQKPVVTRARTSVAGFKLREGMPIGVSVTLRGTQMWEFADRLMAVAIPRIRDFRGLPNKFDGRGNYTMGLSEQSVFPEIHLDKVEFVQGMSITFVTSARTDEEGLALLQRLGMPFRK